jgi:glycosyltransferase involved in cell wall biosynthesis
MSLMNYDINYSLVVYTCNPDERIFKRCLNAIYNLDVAGMTTELIVVDNNSQVPVETLSYVRNFLGMKIIMVPAHGVRYARMAAIEKAAGRYIVYFDFDNEPENDYLQELKKLNRQYPEVAALGPGNVTVDFIDPVDKKIEIYARAAFHERNEASIKFSAKREWQSCYPFGAGLCAPSFLLKEFAQLAKKEKLTMPGRTGETLSSGEDTQMVLLCISKGYFAGVSPTLRLKHVIPSLKTNDNYLKKLAYGTGLCYEPGFVQVFPEHKKKLQKKILSPAKFSSRVVKKYLQSKLTSDPLKIFDLINFIALNEGAYNALSKPVPPIVKKIVGNLKLQ